MKKCIKLYLIVVSLVMLLAFGFSVSADENSESKINKFIFIGDSRTICMEKAISEENDLWITEWAAGLDWMQTKAVPAADEYITEGAAIIILMGMNDQDKVAEYYSYINKCADEWNERGAYTFFVSVNPADGNYTQANEGIKLFNQQMLSHLSEKVEYIDVFSVLMKNGFGTVDGINYDQETSVAIYRYIKNEINGMSEKRTISKYIFIGDSRTAGMRDTVMTDDIWSCEWGKGYNWLETVGVPQIEDKIEADTAVVLLMGVNDKENIDKYIEFANKKAAEWKKKGAYTYYVSVNPCDGQYAGANFALREFNQKLQANLSDDITFIDTYTMLQNDGFVTLDGLHYDEDTYQRIYNYIKKRIVS